MDGILVRLAALALATLGGGLIGALVGAALGVPIAAALAGAVAAAVTVGLRDTVKAYRLADWLRGDQGSPAPRDAGFWGELGYRTEKALRRRERALGEERERREQFLSGIEASPNGVLLLDASDQIDWCNSVAADHFGLDRERDRLQRITNLVRNPAFVAYVQSGSWQEPVTVPRPGGQGTLSVAMRPYGAGLKLVLSQDITERERADTMRRDFVANVSHEIRTPLTVLAGFVDSMASLPLSEAERRRVLVLMSQQTRRMQTLVSDLLTLAQLEGSPRPALDRWLPLSTLLGQVEVDALALSAGRHRIRIEALADVQIAGIEGELMSALSNLVSNAVRYTPDGGHVDVVARLTPESGLELAVTDTGIGITREHLPRLTERFYRVDGSRSRETGGTGLGLSIVKHVAQRHGGSLEIQSEPGRGSVFRLLLPSVRVRVQPTILDGASIGVRAGWPDASDLPERDEPADTRSR